MFLEDLQLMFDPVETALLQNYPNPFNPETWMPYRLAVDAAVSLAIYDTNGRLIREWHLGYQPAGHYVSPSKAVYWDGLNNAGEPVGSGLYFYLLRAGDVSAMRKMAILK